MKRDTDILAAFSDNCGKLIADNAPQATDYIDDLQGEGYDGLDDAEKIELLESLLIIMKSFVNIGHGLDPVNKLIEEFENSGANPVTMINSGNATDDE